MQYEPSVIGKWLAMLKEIAPRLVRVAFVINPKTAPFYSDYLRAADPLSRSLGIELVPTFVETPTEINSAIESFASVPNGGLLVPPDITTFAHRDLIIALAAQHSLPAVYAFRLVVLAGGLMSYGTEVKRTQNASTAGASFDPVAIFGLSLLASLLAGQPSAAPAKHLSHRVS
jgi:putative tryptophan/tyrosine transport system substrate-binding protein